MYLNPIPRNPRSQRVSKIEIFVQKKGIQPNNQFLMIKSFFFKYGEKTIFLLISCQ